MGILILLVCIPFVMMLIGIVQLFWSDAAIRKTGKKLLLIGIALVGVELLIGYSICSNI